MKSHFGVENIRPLIFSLPDSGNGLQPLNLYTHTKQYGHLQATNIFNVPASPLRLENCL